MIAPIGMVSLAHGKITHRVISEVCQHRLASAVDGCGFRSILSTIFERTHAEYGKLHDRLASDLTLLSEPSASSAMPAPGTPLVGNASHSSVQQRVNLPAARKRFLVLFCRLLELSGFKPMTRAESDAALSNAVRISLPLAVKVRSRGRCGVGSCPRGNRESGCCCAMNCIGGCTTVFSSVVSPTPVCAAVARAGPLPHA